MTSLITLGLLAQYVTVAFGNLSPSKPKSVAATTLLSRRANLHPILRRKR